jgi:hypothetical protein
MDIKVIFSCVSTELSSVSPVTERGVARGAISESIDGTRGACSCAGQVGQTDIRGMK